MVTNWVVEYKIANITSRSWTYIIPSGLDVTQCGILHCAKIEN